MNKRQERALAALRTTKTYLYQQPNNGDAKWYVWHPIHGAVRVSLTGKDIKTLPLKHDHQFGYRWIDGHSMWN